MMNSLKKTSDSKFVTRKWNIVNNQSKRNYDAGNEIICNTEVLKLNLCEYIDAYILVRGDIITMAHNNPAPVAFKNCASITKCITKIDGTTIDDAEDLDLVMSMYNLIEFSSNYSDAISSFCLYYKDEATTFKADIADNNNLSLSSIRQNY